MFSIKFAVLIHLHSKETSLIPLLFTSRTQWLMSDLLVMLIPAALRLLAKGQCNDSDVKMFCDNYSPEDAAVCFILYEQLEQALVNHHLNLYNLRHVFFPNDNAGPIVVDVTYNITFHNITNETCAKGSSKGNRTLVRNQTDRSNPCPDCNLGL